MNDLRQILLSSRPLSWVNTAYPFAVAYLLLADPVVWWVLVIGTVFFLVPYNLAMYGINDVFDYESDLRNPRKGGVEGAVLERRLHRPVLLSALLSCLPFVVALIIAGPPLSWAVLAVSLFAVVAYSAKGLRFKERPLLDSMTSSVHFVSPAVYGVALGGGVFERETVLVLVAFFCWGMASHAFGAVQDIPSDRAARIGSIATAFGARWTVRFAFGVYLLAGALLLLEPWPISLAALLAVPYLLMTAPFLGLPDADAERANAGWRWFLAANFVVGFLTTVLVLARAFIAY